MKAVVLVGGQATRLRPITLTIPKALIELQGKAILEHVFDLFKKYEVREVILSVGYLKEKIIDHFGDGSHLDLRISYIEEDEPLGTAGPLKLLQEPITETFICGNGDELKTVDIKEMYEQHKQTGATATLCLTEVEDPTMYGVAKLEGNKILEFVEKPKLEDAPSNFINAGFYMFEPEVIDMIPQGRSMFEYDVFPKLAREGRLYAYKLKGQWFDTGTHERLAHARQAWKGF